MPAIVAEYRDRHTGVPEKRIDEKIRQWGLPIVMVRSSHFEQELMSQTHIAVIRKTT